MLVDVVRHRAEGVSEEKLFTSFYHGRIPCVDERVIVPGPRTYKVSRVTTDLLGSRVTLEVVKVESAYVD